jgi:rod shape-determining protein MreC
MVGAVAFPLQNILSFIGYNTRQMSSFFVSIGHLKQENERLLAENIALKVENADCADRARENEAIRKELGILPRDQFEFVSAEVTGQDDASSGNALLINKGEVSGIRKGLAVIVGKGVLVGRVVETTPFSARVLLLSDSESAVNAVAGEMEARGVVRGEYGLGLVLDMVLQSDTLRVGDEIITSGLGGDVPRGLLIGTATSVESSADRLFQRATLASPTRFDRVRFVSVVMSTKP